VFILNRSPTKALKGVTPYEAWHGRKPNVSYLKTFGCIGHVKKVKPGLAKLDDRSVKAVFLGYESGTKAYRLYDPVRGKVLVSRDVVFDEAAAWRWEEAEAGGGRGDGGIRDSFTVEHLVIHGHGETAGQPVTGEVPDGAASTEPPAAVEAEEPPSPGGAGSMGVPGSMGDGSPVSPA